MTTMLLFSYDYNVIVKLLLQWYCLVMTSMLLFSYDYNVIV